MHWEKKICIRITLQRIVGALVVASIVANLVIVGAVFGADSASTTPTVTALLTTLAWTDTPFAFTSTASETLTPSSTPSSTSTVTSTLTATETPTETLTPTPTFTAQPTLTVCVKRFDWPIYRVERGDTLYALALATGSTVPELKVANCLESDRLVVGQLLYVPRLPATPTATDTLTSPPQDTLTTFEFGGMTCDAPYYVSFFVQAYDPDGIDSISVRVYSSQDSLLIEISMEWIEESYSGGTSLVEPYTIADVAYYRFHAVDGLKNTTVSQPYAERADSCVVGFG